MRTRPPRNVAASVHARLLSRSRETREDFQFLLQRYAAERFLYRLGESRHRDRYVLKGATLFAIWGSAIYRGTRDLDFTGYGASEVGGVLATMRDVCAVSVADDGITFDAGTLRARPIRDEAEYNGLRVQFQAKLGVARIPMQVDIGFGNAIEPPPTEAAYPTLLDSSTPRIRAYPQEAVVAEKLHAMVVLGERTSRYKDFYDLYVFARQFPFDGERLTTAIAATFERRRTAVEPALPAALAPRFYADDERAGRWRAYLTRNSLPGAPADWIAVGEMLRAFLSSPWRAIADNRTFSDTWSPGGPWAFSGIRPPLAPENVRCALQQFRPYPVYKDSGVDWLGEIPAHWEVKRLKLVATLNPRPTELRGFGLEVEVSFVPMEAIGEQGGLDLSKTKPFAEIANGYTYFRDGDVVIAKITPCFENGKGAFAKTLTNGIALGTTELHVLRASSPLHPQFLFYVTLSDAFRRLGAAEMYGAGGQKRVPESFLENLQQPLPPIDEQCAIAAFLDQEMARIDTLVAKKERLMMLLREKRAALITRAVTKGLDPNARMKDSGVEWLGRIPAHWGVTRLRYGCSLLRDGTHQPPERVAKGYPLLSVRNIVDGKLVRLPDDSMISESEFGVLERSFSIQENDVLLAIVGATLGKVALVQPGEPFAVQRSLAVLRPRRELLNFGYLASFLQSRPFQSVLWQSVGYSAQPGIYLNALASFHVAAPSIREQVAIVEFVRGTAGTIDELIGRIGDAIDRLKELRTALISAAVTGKIDVRREAA
jgi:type I restriction enzyme S subunit